MAAIVGAIRVDFDANLRKFSASFSAAAGHVVAFERRAGTVAGRFDRHMGTLTRSAAVTTAAFRRFGAVAATLGIGAGALSVAGLVRFADGFTRLQNSLKIAGLSGTELENTFADLFAIAQRNGAAIEPLVVLYSRLAQAQKELGATSEELTRFSEGVALALRVASSDATQAHGALLQLSQALGGAIVRAEEFNSINEGARPILQAVANGLIEAGGSVAKLRNLVVEGKVASAAFFRAFLIGMGDLEAKAASATPTLAQGFTRVNNAITVLVGSVDRMAGATVGASSGLSTLAAAIEDLAQNEGKLRTMAELAERLVGAFVGLKVGKNFGGIGALIGGGVGAFSPEIRGVLGLTTVGERREGLDAERVDLLRQIADLESALKAGRLAPDQAVMARREVDATRERLRSLMTSAAALQPSVGMGGLQERPSIPRAAAVPVSLAEFPITGTGGDADAIAKRTKEWERETAAIMERIAAFGIETEILGKSTAEAERLRIQHDLLTAAQRDGTTASEAQRAQIAELATAYGLAAEAAEAARLKQQQTVDLQQTFGDAALDVFDRLALAGDDFNDVLADVLRSFARLAAQAALLGTGPLAGLFGGTASPAGGSGIFGAIAGALLGGGTGTGFLYHSGGRGGEGGHPKVTLPLSTIARSPRLHDGLSSREFAAVLQEGEHVLTGRMANRTASTIAGLSRSVGSGGNRVVVNAPITIEGGSTGDPQDDARLAREAAEQIRRAVRKEIRSQTKVGGDLNPVFA